MTIQFCRLVKPVHSYKQRNRIILSGYVMLAGIFTMHSQSAPTLFLALESNLKHESPTLPWEKSAEKSYCNWKVRVKVCRHHITAKSPTAKALNTRLSRAALRASTSNKRANTNLPTSSFLIGKTQRRHGCTPNATSSMWTFDPLSLARSRSHKMRRGFDEALVEKGGWIIQRHILNRHSFSFFKKWSVKS